MAFAQSGATVTVYEKAPALTEVGAGIQISPNGARVLQALDLGELTEAASLRSEAVLPMDALSGREITRFDLTGLAGPSYRLFYRPDLLKMLEEGCLAAGVNIQTGAGVAKSGDDGTLTFEDGTTRTAADLVVGADGIHSVLRHALNGADTPFFTGQVAWRATVDDTEGAAPVARIWMAPRRHVVTYPLKGGKLNVVAVQSRKTWAAEDWHHEEDPASVRGVFSDCAPALRDILARVESARLWGLFRHPVAPNWHDDKRAILGDAAHPTLPFLGQGANLALEDAWALARCCDGDTDLARALGRYQSLRRARAERAIAAANAHAVNYHLEGPRRAISHAGLRALGMFAPNAFVGRLSWLYDYDVTAAV